MKDNGNTGNILPEEFNGDTPIAEDIADEIEKKYPNEVGNLWDVLFSSIHNANRVLKYILLGKGTVVIDDILAKQSIYNYSLEDGINHLRRIGIIETDDSGRIKVREDISKDWENVYHGIQEIEKREGIQLTDDDYDDLFSELFIVFAPSPIDYPLS